MYLPDHIHPFIAGNWKSFAMFGFLFGVTFLLKFVSNCLVAFNSYILSKFWRTNDFTKKYGGQWAVITGASEGIGRAYAFQLAKRKMNVFIISSSSEKLKKVASEIKSLYNVGVRYHPLDLCDLADGEKYEKLENELNAIRVGVLVNNVGMMYERLQYFLTVPKETLLRMIHLNITPGVLLTRIVLPQMAARNNGAIINVSSAAAIQPTPLMTTYAATKSFVESFTEALRYEYSCHNVAMQIVRPFYVSTAMTSKGKPTGFLMVDADSYVDSALCALDYNTGRTYGCWSHGMFGVLGESLPRWLYMLGCVDVNTLCWERLTGMKIDRKTY